MDNTKDSAEFVLGLLLEEIGNWEIPQVCFSCGSFCTNTVLGKAFKFAKDEKIILSSGMDDFFGNKCEAAEIGTVIEGTLRDEDLIPAFTEELKRFAPHHPLLTQMDSGDVSPNDLITALNEVAPNGLYFGSRLDDGADFGWWKDSLDE